MNTFKRAFLVVLAMSFIFFSGCTQKETPPGVVTPPVVQQPDDTSMQPGAEIQALVEKLSKNSTDAIAKGFKEKPAVAVSQNELLGAQTSFSYKLLDGQAHIVFYENTTTKALHSVFTTVKVSEEFTSADPSLTDPINEPVMVPVYMAMAIESEDLDEALMDKIFDMSKDGVNLYTSDNADYTYTFNPKTLSLMATLTDGTATADSKATAKDTGIKGSNVYDITLSLKESGFKEPTLKNSADIATSYKYCTESKTQADGTVLSYDLSLDKDLQIRQADFSARAADGQSNDEVLAAITPYLKFCATMPYEGSDSAAIQTWVEDNISKADIANPTETTIGNAKFSLHGVKENDIFITIFLTVTKAN